MKIFRVFMGRGLVLSIGDCEFGTPKFAAGGSSELDVEGTDEDIQGYSALFRHMVGPLDLTP